jgi:hypothetical protein
MKTITLLLITMLAGYSPFAQSQISQFRGLGRNGVYPDKNLLHKWSEEGPNLLWKKSLRIIFIDSIAVKAYEIGDVTECDEVSGWLNDQKIKILTE